MEAQAVKLLLEIPFERVMEIAAQEDIVLCYNPNEGNYHCMYYFIDAKAQAGKIETASQRTVKLAVAYAIVDKLKGGY